MSKICQITNALKNLTRLKRLSFMWCQKKWILYQGAARGPITGSHSLDRPHPGRLGLNWLSMVQIYTSQTSGWLLELAGFDRQPKKETYLQKCVKDFRISKSCPSSPSTWSECPEPPGLPGPKAFEYRLNNIRAKSKHKATVTNEAKTAKMETMAVETSLEEPPAVPPEK